MLLLETKPRVTGLGSFLEVIFSPGFPDDFMGALWNYHGKIMDNSHKRYIYNIYIHIKSPLFFSWLEYVRIRMHHWISGIPHEYQQTHVLVTLPDKFLTLPNLK